MAPKHLKLVARKSAFAPPRDLGRHGMTLWRAVQETYAIGDIGGVELLAQCCAALDRAEQLAACIERDGPVLYVRGAPKEHPAVRGELAARSFICRTLSRLGITDEAAKPGPGRPGTGIGVTHKDLA